MPIRPNVAASLSTLRYGSARRIGSAADAAQSVEDHFDWHLAGALFQLVGHAYPHVVLVEDIDFDVDVVGGGREGLLQPREEAFAVNQ